MPAFIVNSLHPTIADTHTNTTATTLSTDGAAVFWALITNLTSAVSIESLIYQQACLTSLMLLARHLLMSSYNGEKTDLI